MDTKKKISLSFIAFSILVVTLYLQYYFVLAKMGREKSIHPQKSLEKVWAFSGFQEKKIGRGIVVFPKNEILESTLQVIFLPLIKIDNLITKCRHIKT